METKYEKRWRRRFSFKLLFLWCYFSVNRGIGGFIHHGVVCQTFQKRCVGLSVCVFVCLCLCGYLSYKGVWVCVCVCLCVCVCVCVCVCTRVMFITQTNNNTHTNAAS